MKSLVASLRTVIRPLVPDAVMARYRRHQHSRSVRHNVDLYVTEPRAARRWRAFTPNTYRVISTEPDDPATADDVVFMGPRDDELRRYLGFHGADVVVRGALSRPSMRNMRITEPTIDPRSLATTLALIAEVRLPEDADRATALRMLIDGGARVGILPIEASAPATTHLPAISREVVLIMAAVPLHDIGGGSRAAQIAFELIRRGYHVVYVYRFPSSEAVDLGLRYAHPRLEEYDFETFDVGDLVRRSDRGVIIVEAPIGEFIPEIEHLRETGWTMLYDVIDDWSDRSLGGMWYAPVFEQRIVELADAFSASAPDLQDHISRLGGRAVLAPNAVNESVFRIGAPLPRPPDLPDGPLIGYHGSLYGAWFDWDALRRVTVAYPDHSVVIIGDHRGVPSDLPDSIRFLGLKAQGDLPAYLAHLDVGLVPFVTSNVTHAVSPLKVYEYLACGVPVAAPPLRALAGVEGVALDRDLVAAVAAAIASPRPDPRIALRVHSWGARLEVMFGALQRELREVEDPGVAILRKPPVRYDKQDRWIRS